MIYANFKWIQCPYCKIMKTIDTEFNTDHVCSPAVLAKVEKLLDAVIEVELSTFKEDEYKFWQLPSTKFTQYLAARKLI